MPFTALVESPNTPQSNCTFKCIKCGAWDVVDNKTSLCRPCWRLAGFVAELRAEFERLVAHD